MKRILILAAIAAVAAGVIMTACKSTKPIQKTTGSVEVIVPLSEKEYRSNKDYFRASQSGKSPDLATAKKIALANAKTELAGLIQSFIKTVTDEYTNQRTVGDKIEFENKFEELTRVVVQQMLNDVTVIGDKVFKEPDGKITYYIAIEMSKDPVVAKVSDQISKDAKLQLDFDKHQFQKIFDEEMKKFEERQ